MYTGSSSCQVLERHSLDVFRSDGLSNDHARESSNITMATTSSYRARTHAVTVRVTVDVRPVAVFVTTTTAVVVPMRVVVFVTNAV